MAQTNKKKHPKYKNNVISCANFELSVMKKKTYAGNDYAKLEFLKPFNVKIHLMVKSSINSNQTHYMYLSYLRNYR